MSETAKIEKKIQTEEVKIQKIEKTDLDNSVKAVKKIKIHLICIAVGVSFSIGASFAGGFMLHIAVVFPALPSIVQEVFDRLYKL